MKKKHKKKKELKTQEENLKKALTKKKGDLKNYKCM